VDTPPLTPPPRYTIAVRELCDFTAKQGDLDLRFTPSPTAQQGVAGHQAAAARRGPAYRAEVALSGTVDGLVVRGRADGYDPVQQRLDEVKTFRGELARMPANHHALHWAQAKVYAALLCRQLALPGVTVALVYVDIATQRETVLTQPCDAAALEGFFETLCRRFLQWAGREIDYRQHRDAAWAALRFPFDDFRTGQRTLAEQVFRAAALGRCLMAQAPTGIGKTMATIFPLLKAAPAKALDKVFFLTAKGSGRTLALDALARLRDTAPGLPLRVVELVAREKACEHPDKACHGESCPLARGFYDRLAAAREAAVAAPVLDRQALREIALSHAVCPYYLGQELARWSDVVVGDYNHYFDASALLHGLTAVNQWRVAVLVDEAHNLVERARAMYSVELALADLRGVRAAAPAALKAPLDRLRRAWRTLTSGQGRYAAHAALPARLVDAVQRAAAAIGDVLAEQPVAGDAALLAFHFALLEFARRAESFGEHSLFDTTVAGGSGGTGRAAQSVLCIRNVLPAPFLAPRFAQTHTTVLFSATLTPPHHYAAALGLPGDTAWLEVEAPFAAQQLAVRIIGNVSTRFSARGASVAPIVRLMARQFAAAPGNYLAFFSSFDYLQQVAAGFAACCPGVPIWQQTRRMAEPERDAFLARFVPDGAGIGFAVLGGSFAEGIDLPGTRLVGAFIATLGLPQVNAVNEQMKRRLDAQGAAGFDAVYLFPGIRKVVQAAGRVIRTPTDRGSVFLIDDRFARREVLRLLPSWWNIERVA
jgi:DNA excision repair protein ERCC-2